MGTTNKTEAQMTEAMLRNHLKQQPAANSTCREFDPDLANAYLERVLTPTENSHYESHLSVCTFCRKSVIVLAQLAEAEIPLTAVATTPAKAADEAAITPSLVTAQMEANWLEKLKGWFGLLATPRLALAAAAVIILAVSLPLILWRNYRPEQPTADKIAAAKPSEAAPATPLEKAPPAQGNTVEKNEEHAPAALPQQPSKPAPDAAKQASESSTGNGPASATASGSGAPATNQPPEAKRDEESKPASENRAASNDSDKARRADGNTLPINGRLADNKTKEAKSEVAASNPAPAVEPPATKKELDKVDTKDTMQSGDAGKDKTREKILKPAMPSDGKSSRSTTDVAIKPDAPSPQPPAPPSRERLPEKLRQSYLGGAKIPERSNTTPSKKIKDKYFWLVDDVWTDRDYRKEKQLPEVPLVKDSDNYKEVLSRLSGLQKYFSAFSGNDKVIVVYKDKVYLLLPQDNK